MLISNKGYFGEYGGSFMPEILHEVIEQLRLAYQSARDDQNFWQEYTHLLQTYSCRPTPVTFAENLTAHFAGPNIYIKREDLNQTGSHKLNNVLGQCLLAKKMGKARVIAETGAGQHGVATASLAAKLGLKCTIYMGETDVKRQYPNVFWMRKLGAEVVAVDSGSKTLKDAMNEALRDWSQSLRDTHYVIGTACGPHPFPEMVAWFQSIIGQELKTYFEKNLATLPKAIFACVGGGSNASGIFLPFLEEDSVELIGVEAGGEGIESNMHAARIASNQATAGVVQGFKTYFLQNSEGQMNETHSIAAGLDYVGVSPILAHLSDLERVQMIAATDKEVIEAVNLLMQNEGIIPALESSHAFAGAFKQMDRYSSNDSIVINLSGRGDKDIFTIAAALGDPNWGDFIAEYANKYEVKPDGREG